VSTLSHADITTTSIAKQHNEQWLIRPQVNARLETTEAS
jgi:hypothetical protein